MPLPDPGYPALASLAMPSRTQPGTDPQARLLFVGAIMESKRHAARLKALKQPVHRSVESINDAVDVAAWLRDSPWQVVWVSIAVRETPYQPTIASNTDGKALAVRLDALNAPDPATAAPGAILEWVKASLTAVGRRRGLGPLPGHKSDRLQG